MTLQVGNAFHAQVRIFPAAVYCHVALQLYASLFLTLFADMQP